jgi:acetylornithine deacetylase/succinyl-diaminopimelate desuccinylase-like protein
MPISKPRVVSIFICLIVFTSTNSIAQKSKPSLSAYEKYIDDNNDAHLKEYLEIVSIPTISSIPSHKPDVARAAAWIANKLKAIGMSNVQLIPTEGNPVVYASWDKAPGKPIVLIYAHYDVQPVKESEWDNPPFSPMVKDGKIFGRGASDDKSGVMITMLAIETMLHVDGKLPVNVKFMFEGNEEMGSPYFKSFLEKNKELLKADFVLNADDGQYNENTPAITVSLRGAVRMEFSVKTANTDAHSGEFGGKTPNAVVDMAQIIGSFYDKAGNVAVEGFYDKVVPVTAEQKAMIKKIRTIRQQT